MRTHDFEQSILDLISKAKHSSLRTALKKKYSYITVVKKKSKIKFANSDYEEMATLEIPTIGGHILVTIYSKNNEISFHYFGITKDENSNESLSEEYSKYCVFKSLGMKI